MLVTLFTAGLVAAGVVAGAGPLAVLSEPTSTESTTDPGTTSTESETTTESAPESTTTETETYLFKGEQLIGVTNISTGKKGHPTPLGFWTINWKRPMYRSKKYDNAPMPFMQNIDDRGIALHGGVTPGYPASHGCIRLPMAFAKQLYGLTKPGNKVVIEG